MVAEAVYFVELLARHIIPVMLAKCYTTPHSHDLAAILVAGHDYVIVQYLFYQHVKFPQEPYARQNKKAKQYSNPLAKSVLPYPYLS